LFFRDDYLEKNPVENYPGLQFVYCDGLILFALTREMRKSEKGNPEFVAHVIDAEQGNILSRVYIPFHYEFVSFKNGRAYTCNQNEEGSTVVEVYDIDPAVYGK